MEVEGLLAKMKAEEAALRESCSQLEKELESEKQKRLYIRTRI